MLLGGRWMGWRSRCRSSDSMRFSKALTAALFWFAGISILSATSSRVATRRRLASVVQSSCIIRFNRDGRNPRETACRTISGSAGRSTVNAVILLMKSSTYSLSCCFTSNNSTLTFDVGLNRARNAVFTTSNDVFHFSSSVSYHICAAPMKWNCSRSSASCCVMPCIVRMSWIAATTGEPMTYHRTPVFWRTVSWRALSAVL